MSALSPKRTQQRHRKLNPLGAKLSKDTLVGRSVYGRAPPEQRFPALGMVPGAPSQMPNPPLVADDPLPMVPGAPAQLPNDPLLEGDGMVPGAPAQIPAQAFEPIQPRLRPPRRYPKFTR